MAFAMGQHVDIADARQEERFIVVGRQMGSANRSARGGIDDFLILAW